MVLKKPITPKDIRNAAGPIKPVMYPDFEKICERVGLKRQDNSIVYSCRSKKPLPKGHLDFDSCTFILDQSDSE